MTEDEKCNWGNPIPIPIPDTDGETICLVVCGPNGDGFRSYKIHGTGFDATLGTLNGKLMYFVAKEKASLGTKRARDKVDIR
jgi:hypothetical protein